MISLAQLEESIEAHERLVVVQNELMVYLGFKKQITKTSLIKRILNQFNKKTK